MKFYAEISNYVTQITEPLTLKRFIEDNSDFIIQNTSPDEDFESVWTTRFKTVCKDLKKPMRKSKPDWGKIAVGILAQRRKKGSSSRESISSGVVNDNGNSSASSVSTVGVYSSVSNQRSVTISSTPSTSSSEVIGSGVAIKKLSKEARNTVNDMYQSLKADKMWKLSDDLYVEIEMEKLANKFEYENLTHSIIMDTTSPIYNNCIGDDYMKYITNYQSQPITPLSDELEQYFNRYANCTTLTQLREINRTESYNPDSERELYWISISMSKIIDLFHFNYLFKQRSEADLLKHVWCIIDNCFLGNSIEVVSGEGIPKATTKRVNAGRAMPTDAQLERRKSGSKIDIIFKTDSYELGMAEAGKITDTVSTKSFLELNFKMPKILKDMFVDLATESPSKLRDIKVYGFIIAGLQIMPVVLDCPAGYVCRFRKLSSWLHFPSSPTDLIPRMRLLCTILIHIRNDMSSVVRAIESDSNALSLSFTDVKKSPIPPCITVFSPPKGKRKAEEMDL